ncbi:hypothetical protein B5807_07564 [Epicoccum nigrum]|uniref:Uncharacterized protein n=1 Tax=Epicoccum nigrum TaxID=105696 RepID=A0A1Y2LVL0_EPING|nr:hypothetical protein B5807_07564 [Epicoccum nigrum]
MMLDDELQKTQQQVESHAEQLAAGSNHLHATINHLNTEASPSLFNASNRFYGLPGTPYMHPTDMAFGQPSSLALHEHHNNVLKPLFTHRQHPVEDHFIAPFASLQLRRAATHGE